MSLGDEDNQSSLDTHLWPIIACDKTMSLAGNDDLSIETSFQSSISQCHELFELVRFILTI